MRTVSLSNEMLYKVNHSPDREVKIYSFFPCDRSDCECQKMIKGWKERIARLNESQRSSLLEKTKFLVCPKDKTGMNRYQITCKNCKEILGYCYASDNTLRDWCDFHYTNWVDKDGWHGCLTPHISPITEELCFECCCGEDTRDFRANMTLPTNIAVLKERFNSIGRAFGTKDSTFQVRKVADSMILSK